MNEFRLILHLAHLLSLKRIKGNKKNVPHDLPTHAQVYKTCPTTHTLLQRLLRLLGGVLQILQLTLCLALCVLQALVVEINTTDLSRTDAKDEEVDSGESNVLGADDEAPAGPDGTCAHEGKVLGEGEGFGGAGEVGGAGEDHAPFHYWGPAEVISTC